MQVLYRFNGLQICSQFKPTYINELVTFPTNKTYSLRSQARKDITHKRAHTTYLQRLLVTLAWLYGIRIQQILETPRVLICSNHS